MDPLTQERTIKDHKVSVRPFRGSLSNKMLVRLQQCLDGRTIICDPDTWQKFCLEFLAYTFIDAKEIGQEVIFDSVFCGNLSLLFEAIYFTSEVNFGKDFFLQSGSTGGINQSGPQMTEK
jgi:hypothetical protein